MLADIAITIAKSNCLLQTAYCTLLQLTLTSGATTSAPAIFEIKTYTGCKPRYDHTNTMNPADRHAKDIKNEYVSKFRNLDNVFAADVVGDVMGAIEGPFERAQRCFHTKQLIPLCAGWFGKVNKGMVIVLKELARLTTAGDLGISISPLSNTDKKGGRVPNHVAAV